MMPDEIDDQDLDRYATVLVHQTDQLIAKLDVEIGVTPEPQHGSRRYRSVFQAYERLAEARRQFSGMRLGIWENTKVDGRGGEDLMDQTWKFCKKLKRLGEGMKSASQNYYVLLLPDRNGEAKMIACESGDIEQRCSELKATYLCHGLSPEEAKQRAKAAMPSLRWYSGSDSWPIS